MFRWLKSDYDKRVEEANNEFRGLYDENQDLKRENRLLKQVNERHRETIKCLDNEVDRFPNGGIVYAKPKGEMFIPFKMLKQEQPNLLEIKLKNTDSVPEVWYEGERLDEAPKCLFSIDYKWETRDVLGFGEQELEIKYYEQPDNQFLDMKTISHKRVGG